MLKGSATGKSDLIALGPGAAPHGVIVGPDGAAWVTEGGQNAIARVDPATRAVKLFPLPKERRNANLNTATFDRQGVLWFTGQNGIYGRLYTKTGALAVFDAPRGTRPYGIATTLDGQVFFASLAGNYLGQIDLEIGEFIRRFLTHVLPKGFHRIRHYGLFASSNRTETMEAVRKLLNLAPPVDAQTSQTDPAQPLANPCPCCGGRMIIIETFEAGCQPRRQPTAPLVTIRIDTS